MNDIYDTLETMERMGGSFIKQLAILYRHADDVNREALSVAFYHYFREYDELTTLRKARCKTTGTAS